MIWSLNFWKGATERAAKTLAQAFVAVILASVGADSIGVGAGVLDVDWVTALSVAGLAAILSLVTSIGNADFTAGQHSTVPEGTHRREDLPPYVEELVDDRDA